MKDKSLSWNSDILRKLTLLGVNGGSPTRLRIPAAIPSFPVPPDDKMQEAEGVLVGAPLG